MTPLERFVQRADIFIADRICHPIATTILNTTPYAAARSLWVGALAFALLGMAAEQSALYGLLVLLPLVPVIMAGLLATDHIELEIRKTAKNPLRDDPNGERIRFLMLWPIVGAVLLYLCPGGPMGMLSLGGMLATIISGFYFLSCERRVQPASPLVMP